MQRLAPRMLAAALVLPACDAAPAGDKAKPGDGDRAEPATKEEPREGAAAAKPDAPEADVGLTLNDAEGKTHPLKTVLMKQLANGSVDLVFTNQDLDCKSWLAREPVRIKPASEVEAKASIKREEGKWAVSYLSYDGTSSQVPPLGTVEFAGDLDPAGELALAIHGKLASNDTTITLKGKATAKGCGKID